jgi:hypothetical protein
MEKDKDRDERTHDLYGEDDIPKSNILDITLFMDKNAKKEAIIIFLLCLLEVTKKRTVNFALTL